MKNKRELWKAQSYLRRFRNQARRLQAKVRLHDAQADLETRLLLARLIRLGILSETATSLDDVLGLNVEDLLKRRLQTLMFTRGLAFTAVQSRQWIVHGHVSLGGRRVNVPGYIVPRHLEQTISFATRSALSSDMHPARHREDEEVRMPPAEAEAPKVEEKSAAPAPGEKVEAVAPAAQAPEAKS